MKPFKEAIQNGAEAIMVGHILAKDIDKKYSDLSNYKLRKYYDNCFCMMSYLIRTENIIKARDEIRNENR